MSRLRVILSATIFFLVWPVTAGADEVLLSGAGKYIGEIVDESDTEVTIKTAAGTFTVDKSEVGLVVRGKAARIAYEAKRANLSYDDVSGHYRLGQWCRASGLTQEATLQFEYCLRLDPGHARAHHALGHTRYEGKWITKEQMRAQGFEKYKDRWLSREEAERLRQADLKRRLEAEWSTRIQRLRAQVTHPLVSVRLQAEKQLLEISDPAAFPAIVRLLEDYHPRVRWLALELVNRYRIPEAAPTLAKLSLHDSEPRLRDTARVTLLDIKDEEALKALIKGLRHQESDVRHRACIALGQFRDQRAVPFLIRSIKEVFLVSVKDGKPLSLKSTRKRLPIEEVSELPPLVRHSLFRYLMEDQWNPSAEPDKKLVVRINQDALDALKAITGEDFGSDEDAWQDWWHKEGEQKLKQQHEKRKEPAPSGQQRIFY